MRVRRILTGAAALVVAVGLATVGLRADAAVTPVYDNGVVGFSEGAGTAGLVGRLDRMDDYVGERKPMLRLDLNWWGVQGCDSCAPDFSTLDPVVDAAAARGIRVLLILTYAPPWANGGHDNDHWFPVDDGDWTAIVDATVAHFAGKVQAYEVWNEPNFVHMGNFGDGSAAARRARYWRLVEIAHARVHAGCADCVVLAGASGAGTPVTNTRDGNPNESSVWLEWAYANGYGDDFDAVTHHPYAPWSVGLGPSYPECTAPRWWNMFGPPDEKCGELAAVRAVMVRHGDGAKKIWATEFGYPSAGTGISAAQRRDFLEEGVRNWRALDYTGPFFLFSFADSPRADCAGSADPECFFGVVDAAGAAKQPAYDGMRLALTDTRLESLAPGRSLHRASALWSSLGRFTLWLQGDGNLVLYQGSTVLWKVVNLKGVRLTNQTDGSLALFDVNGKKVWSTPTAGKGASTLIMQNDGNLVLYPAATPTKASWASNTCCH
jgi:hypothetical protein